MVCVGRLGDDERQRLKKLARREVGRVSERIRMVLLSSRGYTVQQIAEVFEVDEATVRGWLSRYEAEGVNGLKDRPRSGRPCKAGTAAREELRLRVDSSPEEAGYGFGYWTVATLVAHLAVRLGLVVSGSAVRRSLHSLGYRFRRPRHVLPTDPLAAAKMWRLCDRVMAAPAGAVLLCLDECDLHLLPPLRRMWMRRGRQAHVPTPGTNRKRSIFGALDPATGAWTYTVTERKRSEEFIAFVEKLLGEYPAVTLLLVLDNASIHTSKAVAAWVEVHQRVELLFLPSYAGHEQNPVEKVWWRMKDRVAANRLRSDIGVLMGGVDEFFDSFTPQDALKLAA